MNTKPHFVRTPYNYDVSLASQASGLTCGPSKAKQEFKEECDINTIWRNFGMGYQMPAGLHVPTYGDFSGVEDFQSAMNAISLANETFDALPAEVRDRFAHNPGAFVDFCSDDRNRDELIKLGLIVVPETHDRAGDRLPIDPARVVATPPSETAPKPSNAPAGASNTARQGRRAGDNVT